jgi:single-strand DNA-binding protein
MSFSKITVIGNLGRDPELRYTPQGDAVCDFSVAVNDRKRDKAGEFQDVTTWFKVTFWRKQAETASKYLTKGKSVYVEGRLQVEEWSDRDGNKRFSLVIQGTDLQFIGDSRGSEDSSAASSSGSSSPNDDFTESQESGDKRGRNSGEGGEASAGGSPADDDIPF